MTIPQPTYPIRTDDLVTHIGGYVDSRMSPIDTTVVYGSAYGVVGDGVTNCTTAINAAIAAAVLKWSVFGTGVARVILPPGKIMTNGGHTDGGGRVVLQGQGREVTVLYVRSAATPGTDILTLNTAQSGVVGLTVDGNKTAVTTGDGIVLNATQQVVADFEVRNVGGNGISVGKTTAAPQSKIGRGQIRYAKGYGIRAYGGSTTYDGQWMQLDIGNSGKSGVKLDAGAHNLTDIHSWGNGIESGYGMATSFDSAGFYVDGSNHSLVNCQAETNCGEGLFFGGTNNSWVGGSIWGNNFAGVSILINANRNSVVGSRIYRNGAANAAIGSTSTVYVGIRNEGKYCTIIGNHIWDDNTAIAAGSYDVAPTYPYPGKAAAYGMSRAYLEASPADLNTVVGNTMRGEDTRSGTPYILVGAGSVVRANVIGAGTSVVPTVASAAAITIPADAKDGLCKVTGTVGITSVAATPPNTRVTLIFTDASPGTVTDGSNLKLASTFAPTTDDTLSLVCDGTNWFEIARSVN